MRLKFRTVPSRTKSAWGSAALLLARLEKLLQKAGWDFEILARFYVVKIEKVWKNPGKTTIIMP